MPAQVIAAGFSPALKALIEALGLDVRRLTRFVLTVEIGSIATVDASWFLEEPDAEGATEVAKRFALLELKGAGQ